MPERDSSPENIPAADRGDLFANLPDPQAQVPTVDNTPPPAGSRRAAREAVQHGDVTPPAPVVPEPTVAAAPEPRAVTKSSSLEDLFEAEPVVTSGKPEKKRRRKGCLVTLIILLAVLGGITAGAVWVWNTYGEQVSDLLGWGEPKDWEEGLATGEVFVIISEGDTGQPVSTALYEAGVTKTESVFYDYLVDENIAFTFYPGVYSLQEKMTAAAAAEALRNPDNKLANTANVPEGGTIDNFLPSIAASMEIPLVDFEAAVADPAAYGVSAPSLEGWLFPANYTFDPGVTAPQVIQKMVDRTREALTAAGVPAGDENRVLTIAAIIQREGRTADFDKVSRVIQNRLDDGMKLQMDSTSQYGYGELHAGVVSTSEEAQFDDNPWNTYVIPGLPVGPISSVSQAAIDAAMNPADGPWFYFVTINPQSGETVFSTTYEEHQRGIEQWGEWCAANPDQGC